LALAVPVLRDLLHAVERQADGETTMSEQATQLLTIPETADLLRTSVRNVRLLIRSGELPAVKVGRRNRVDPVKLQNYISAGGAAKE
jgi:excisionase family DNA binding protein